MCQMPIISTQISAPRSMAILPQRFLQLYLTMQLKGHHQAGPSRRRKMWIWIRSSVILLETLGV